MRNLFFTSMAALLLATVPAAGQTTAAQKAKTAAAVNRRWTPPRTPDGQPDLQGVWTNNSVTPLQRPKELAGKEYYTEAELAQLQKRERDRLALDDVEGEPPANHSGVEGAPAENVHYDHAQFGLDWLQSRVAWNRRTSLIVGPEGTIPPLTPEARKRLAEIAAKEKGHEFDGPENRPLAARCIARPSGGPPLLPTRYNSNLQIVQGPGYVAIETEEIHDVRMIPTDGRPHLPKNIHQWMGDSVGHWEGNTLVIDTTNFTDLNPFPGAQNLHVIERITRADEDTILYEFTVEDPGMWTKPWSGEVPIKKISGQLYEYACHEANYGLANTLHGARVAEAQAAAKEAAK
ncbi:MAG: hypothetical protein DMG31_12105 [Acidobacteria bacterium]|nr:MAG: hypothetical protein DMG31_12105 [Acidobacteriota bacterium]